LLDLWKGRQVISRRLIAYDTTNFYTYIASNHTRNELAQRGHNPPAAARRRYRNQIAMGT
jgi:hypothetical protein